MPLRISIVAVVVVALTGLGILPAQAAQSITLPTSAPLFCLDSTSVYQPFKGVDYGRLADAFNTQFGWQHSLTATGPSTGELVFSISGRKGDGESITYDVRAHQDGIALQMMHVRLQGVSEDNLGTDMCTATWGIVFGQ